MRDTSKAKVLQVQTLTAVPGELVGARGARDHSVRGNARVAVGRWGTYLRAVIVAVGATVA